MKFTYDPVKSTKNVAERGISFDLAKAFEWDTAVVNEDTRKDYGEPRFKAMGLIKGRLHILVFTPRKDEIRVISLRKANAREVKAYEKET